MNYDDYLRTQVDRAMDIEDEASERWDEMKEDWVNDGSRYKIVVRIEDAEDERFNQEIEVEDAQAKKDILNRVDKSNGAEVDEIFNILVAHC